MRPLRERLLIFDCDGVLVDSEALVIEIEAELLQAAGVSMTAAEIATMCVGLSDGEIHRRIEDRWQVRLPRDFADKKHARITEAFEARLQPVPGIPRLLRDVGGARCVASSSTPARIRRSLQLTALLEHFEPNLFSAEMVSRGKPEPDVFLYAARMMDTLPEASIVIEDSAYGVAAGRAAAMTVIGFTGASHCSSTLGDELLSTGAHHVAHDASDLSGVLGKLL